MHGLPVTIRLLDPPLNEFLPKTEEAIAEVAGSMGVDPAHLRERVHALTESNPMVGHGGCRLLITYPEIPEMQTRAILEAAAEAALLRGCRAGLCVLLAFPSADCPACGRPGRALKPATSLKNLALVHSRLIAPDNPSGRLRHQPVGL